jgi:ribosomal protein S12 methylthiotransferase
MLGHLMRDRCILVRDLTAAEVVVVNTCGFIDAAREESIQTILDAAELKKTGRCRHLVVAGCLVQRHHRELAREIPEIDAFVGLDELERIVDRLNGTSGHDPGPAPSPGAEPSTSPLIHGASRRLYDAGAPRHLSGPPWSAYLKVAEGCDQPCSFCAIPSFRGAFRSRPLADLQAEAVSLARRGVVELNLISQDTTSYGKDIGLEEGPALLLETLDQVDGLHWIRPLYLHPARLSDRFLAALGGRDRVVPYADIPLQHAHPEVLRRMQRGGSAESHLKLLERLRRVVPDLTVRTTFMVGFPGETEEEFRVLLDFVDAARFEAAGVFLYSHEEGTAAARRPDDVPREVKEERRDRLMKRQQPISLDKNRGRVGRVLEVLCEGTCEETEHLLQGRLGTQAPDIDGRVLINDGLAPAGSFARVEITEAHPYDLVGRVLP